MVNSTYSGKVHGLEDHGNSACSLVARYAAAADDGQQHQEKEKRRKVSVNFRSQSFPAVRIRFGEAAAGTVNLFNNGSYVLVGVKGQEEADKSYDELCALMSECSLTSK